MNADQLINAQGGEVVVVIEKFVDKATAFAQKFSIAHQYATVEEAFAAMKFDALIIGAPNYLHAPQAITALSAGIPVLVEKPIGLNALEGQQMTDARLKADAVLMVAHCWRFDEEAQWLRSQAN